MADKWDGDTMPVELAIQRELSYRRKLTLQLKPDGDFPKDLTPLQAQSSTLSPILEQPSSSNTSSAAERKEPPRTSILETLPIVEKVHQSFHGNPMPENTPTDDKLHCIICNLVCSSEFNLKQHLIGQEHMAKLQELLEHPSPSTVILSGTKRKEPFSDLLTRSVPEKQLTIFRGNYPMTGSASVDRTLHCKLCNVVCSSGFNLEQHMNGQKHQAKLQGLPKRQRRWCEVCEIPCMNEDSLKMHFEGKKHKAKLLGFKLSARKGNGEIAAERQSLYCKLCRIWCIDECCFKQHLAGKKHKLLLHENFPKQKMLPWRNT